MKTREEIIELREQHIKLCRGAAKMYIESPVDATVDELEGIKTFAIHSFTTIKAYEEILDDPNIVPYIDDVSTR